MGEWEVLFVKTVIEVFQLIQVCVRSAILYKSETWCSREREVVLLKRIERAMMKAMCRVKLIDRKNTKELMQMLVVAVPIERKKGVAFCEKRKIASQKRH